VTAALTPKAVTYVFLTAFGLFAGLLTGRVELVVLVTPMVVALALGLALTEQPGVLVGFSIDADRCLEGDAIRATISIAGDRYVSEAEVALVVPEGFRAVGEAAHTIALRAGEPRVLEIPLRAERWGARTVGKVAVQSRGPGRLLVFETVAERGRPVRVYPQVERMMRALQPPETQVYTGNYVSRSSGDGIEFSEVRPYGPGDSRRTINWRVTSRRGQLHVNEFHPERNADVVLFLDTFADVGAPGRTSLDLGVRGAAIMASHYLARKDRVGLVAFGGLLGWMSATSGQQHLHRIVDYLIGVETSLSYARKDISYLPPRSLPQAALVVAFSPLVDERALKALADLHARGYHLVVIDTLLEEAVTPGRSPEDRAAFRVWRLQRAAQRFNLESQGVPIVQWPGHDALEAALGALPPLSRMPRAPRAR
jgi:uncharacterized protein (DUF58 family)